MSALQLILIGTPAGAPSFTTPVASLAISANMALIAAGSKADRRTKRRAHDLEGDRRAQEAHRRADAGAGRDQHVGDAELFGQTRGMERRAAAEGDQGAAFQLGAALDGVDAGGIGHVLFHHLGDAERRHGGVELELAADMGVERRAGQVWRRA